ncbi:MAG TPA: ImmA/IrrE family metallo-endopeptidase [Solirubrobacterales bacterium]|nr:ImmA/IrrE family metallo-endopeptidase [Solirubrobacterales bacterium]
MSDLTLNFEWIDPAEARGTELRATWARLEILLGGIAITRLIDFESRGIRNSVFLPLYPLAEWLATHWWFLFYEVETLGRSTSDQYDRRHNLRYGAEGFAVPSLSIQPLGEQIKLEWRQARLDAQNLEFTESGSVHVFARDLRQTLFDFISAVLKRLQEMGVVGTLLEEEWRSIRAVDPEERDFCSAVASLGLDPYTLDEGQQQKILDVSELLPASLLGDFFAVADFSTLPLQASQVLDALESSRNNNANLVSLKSLKEELASAKRSQGPPWRQGYQIAHDLRRRLNLNGEKLSSLPLLAKALAILPRQLEAAILKMPALPSSLDALGATNSRQSPGFVVSERREAAVRFAFCRALFEYLTIPADQPMIVTRARSERQKRNRAFAAEFLVPADLLRGALPGDVVGDEDIDDLAASFGVSPSVIRHQIENHELARSLPD